MANVRNTTLYTGVTSDLYARVYEHKEGKHPKSFTARYNITKLVYYESFRSIEEAIDREKQIKGGSRADKENLINSLNPEWKDLFEVVKNGNIHRHCEEVRRSNPQSSGRNVNHKEALKTQAMIQRHFFN